MRVNSVLPKIQKAIKSALPNGEIKHSGNQYVRSLQGIDKKTGATATATVAQSGSWSLLLKNNPCYNDVIMGELMHNGEKYQFSCTPQKKALNSNLVKDIKMLIKDHFNISKKYIERRKATKRG